MKKQLLALACIIAFSTETFALTCPDPSTIVYQNGQWTAPSGWTFNQVPNPSTKVGSFQGVEWQAMVAGSKTGVIDWCKYDSSSDPISLTNSAFVQRDLPNIWNAVGTRNIVFRCTTSIAACSMSPSQNTNIKKPEAL